MNTNLKVAFVYKSSQSWIHKNFYCPNDYNFYLKTLASHPKLDYTTIPADDSFDIKTLNKFDCLIFYDLASWGAPPLDGLENINKPKIARAGDCHHVKNGGGDRNKLAQQYDVKHMFFHHPRHYFYKYFSKNIQYHQIFVGVEPEFYSNLNTENWDKRYKSKILVTGSLYGNAFYNLRIKCAISPYTYYSDTMQSWADPDPNKVTDFTKNIGNNFPGFLSNFQAAVAACTTYVIWKYIEMPAAGCLTFMEANKNNGWDDLGFIDGETCITIDENNYNNRLREYQSSAHDPKWKQIAENGRRFSYTNYNSKIQSDRLVNILYTIS